MSEHSTSGMKDELILVAAEGQEKLRQRIATIEQLLATSQAREARLREALRYAGVGEPYPWNRLTRLIESKRLTCVNQDDKDYWSFVIRKMESALAADPGPTSGCPKSRKEFKMTQIEQGGQWETLASKDDPTGSEWRAEYIDYKGDGRCYVTIFSGPKAMERAKEYAALVDPGQAAERVRRMKTEHRIAQAAKALVDNLPDTSKYDSTAWVVCDAKRYEVLLGALALARRGEE